MLRPEGHTGLLTGDIGTGKSTLVDAITTLLVPPNKDSGTTGPLARVVANAPSDLTCSATIKLPAKTLRTQSARPVALRDETSYSVVLGCVQERSRTCRTVTLGPSLVDWSTAIGQPKYFYAAAEREMSITEDFAALRRRGQPAASCAAREARSRFGTSFPSYSAWFRRRFGIHHEQALGAFSPDRVDEVRGQPHELRAQSHAWSRSMPHPTFEKLIAHFDDSQPRS